MGLACATWLCLEASDLAPKLGPEQAQCAQHGLARTQLGPGLPPKGAQLGPKLVPSRAEVGPTAIQMGPKLKPCDAHGNPSHIQSGASWDPLATASHQVGPNRDTTWGTLRQRKRHQQQKTWEMPVKTGVLRILYWASFVPTLKQYGPQLGPKLLQTVQVGAKLRHRPKLEPSGSKLGQMVDLANVGPICKICKLSQSRALFCRWVHSCHALFGHLNIHTWSERDVLLTF